MGILERINELFTGGGGYQGSPDLVDVNSAMRINPHVYKRYQEGSITGDELYQILTKGNVDAWAKPEVEPEVAGAIAPAPGQLMDNIGPQMVNGYQVYGNPSPSLSSWYETPQQRDPSYPYKEGATWTPAPFVGDTPQKPMDFYENYVYNSNGKGAFKKPLDAEYIQALWNEINQQAPDASPDNKIAFLETMLSMTHTESHGGRDAGWRPRVSNVFNMGYSADPGSTLGYDPEDINEMADFAVERYLNRFKVMDNKGMSDNMLRSYAPFTTPEEYNRLRSGWYGTYGTTTPWN